MDSFYVWTLYTLHLATFAYVLGEIHGYKYAGKYRLLYRIFELICVMVIMYGYRTYWPLPNALRTVIGYIVSCSFFAIPYKGKLGRRLWMALGLTVVEAVMELLSYGILQLVGIYRGEYWYGTSAYYAISVYYMILFIGFMFVVWVEYIRKKWFKQSYLFLFFPIYQTILLAVFLLSNLRSGAVVMLIGWLTVIFEIGLDMSIIWFVNGNMKKLEAEEKLSTLYNQRQYELDYYRSMNQCMEEIRGIRHDFMNQVQTAYILLKNDNASDKLASCHTALRELTDKTHRLLKGYRQGSYCKNPVLDAILVLKEKEAVEKGINMTVGCNIGENIKMSEVEICSLFGNLLDNAIEASSKVTDDRRILLSIVEQADVFKIECMNTFVPPKDGKRVWVSRKKDVEAHGLGMKMIEKICKKHNGSMEKKVQDNVVYILIAL